MSLLDQIELNFNLKKIDLENINGNYFHCIDSHNQVCTLEIKIFDILSNDIGYTKFECNGSVFLAKIKEKEKMLYKKIYITLDAYGISIYKTYENYIIGEDPSNYNVSVYIFIDKYRFEDAYDSLQIESLGELYYLNIYHYDKCIHTLDLLMKAGTVWIVKNRIERPINFKNFNISMKEV